MMNSVMKCLVLEVYVRRFLLSRPEISVKWCDSFLTEMVT